MNSKEVSSILLSLSMSYFDIQLIKTVSQQPINSHLAITHCLWSAFICMFAYMVH